MSLKLKVDVVDAGVTKTVEFRGSDLVFDAGRKIQAKIPGWNPADEPNYGIFLPPSSSSSSSSSSTAGALGIWLESSKPLKHYLLKDGDVIQFKKKIRILRVRMLDGAVKALQVSESETVAQLMISICSKIGIANHEEYSLILEIQEDEAAEKEKMATMSRHERRHAELKKAVKTDDDVKWLDPGTTLAGQPFPISQDTTLLLKRKFFFSDQNINSSDPKQLNLLYEQCREGILKGTHPVSLEQSIKFAGIQAQIKFGDHNPSKHKKSLLTLSEFIPKEYVKSRGMDKKIFNEHKKYTGYTDLQAKQDYCWTARGLPTYGITFFLIKEKMQGANKLVARLLGVSKNAVMKLDINTKEILKEWQLTMVKRWAASPTTFTLDFGEYADAYYAVQTDEGDNIARLIAGYVDIILKSRRDYLGLDGTEGEAVEEYAGPARGVAVEGRFDQRTGKGQVGEVAMGENMPEIESARGDLVRGKLGSLKQPGQLGYVAIPGLVGSTGASKEGQGQIVAGVGMIAKAGYVAMPGIVGSGSYDQNYRRGDVQGVTRTGRASVRMINKHPAQKAFANSMGNAQRNLKSLHSASEEDDYDYLPFRDEATTNEEALLRQQALQAHLGRFNANLGKLVNGIHIEESEKKFKEADEVVNNLSLNFEEALKETRRFTSLQTAAVKKGKLTNAVKLLVNEFGNFLDVAGNLQDHEKIEKAAKDLAAQAKPLMELVTAEMLNPKPYRDISSKLKAASDNLVNAIEKSIDNPSPEEEESIKKSLKHFVDCVDNLQKSGDLLYPHLKVQLAQSVLLDAISRVTDAMDDLISSLKHSSCIDQSKLADIEKSAEEVTKSLRDLMDAVQKPHSVTEDKDSLDKLLEDIVNEVKFIKVSFADKNKVQTRVNNLSKLSSTIASMLEQVIQESPDKADDVNDAIFILKETTDHVIHTAGEIGGEDVAGEKNFTKALNDFLIAVNLGTDDSLRYLLGDKFKSESLQLSQAVILTASAAEFLAKTNPQHQPISGLREKNAKMKEFARNMILAVQKLAEKEDDDVYRKNLTECRALCEECMTQADSYVEKCRSVVPTLNNESEALLLSEFCQVLQEAISLTKASSDLLQPLHESSFLDNAIRNLNSTQQELIAFNSGSSNEGLIRSLSFTEKHDPDIALAAKSLLKSTKNLVYGFNDHTKEDLKALSKEIEKNLKTFIHNLKAELKDENIDADSKQQLLSKGIDVTNSTAKLLEFSRAANFNDPNTKSCIEADVKKLENEYIDFLKLSPFAKQLQNNIDKISGYHKVFSDDLSLSTENLAFEDAVSQFLSALSGLDSCISGLAHSSSGIPRSFPEKFNKSISVFMETSYQLLSFHDQNIVGDVKPMIEDVLNASNSLLLNLLEIQIDISNEPPEDEKLLTAVKTVTDSLKQLLSLKWDGTAHIKECENAIKRLQQLKNKIDNNEIDVSKKSPNHFEIKKHLLKRSDSISSSISLLNTGFATDNSENIVLGVRKAEQGVTELVNELIACYDVKRPIAAILDANLFNDTEKRLENHIDTLLNDVDPANRTKATENLIADVKNICNVAKESSFATVSDSVKKKYIIYSKNLAKVTSNIITAIKDGDTSKKTNQAEEFIENLHLLCNAVRDKSLEKESNELTDDIRKQNLQLLDSAIELIKESINKYSKATDSDINVNSNALLQIIKEIGEIIERNRPGLVECQEASAVIQSLLQGIDEAVINGLEFGDETSLEGDHQKVTLASKQALKELDNVVNAATNAPNRLGLSVKELINFFDPLLNGSIRLAAQAPNERSKDKIVNNAKTAGESIKTFITNITNTDPENISSRVSLAESKEDAESSINELIEAISCLMVDLGQVHGIKSAIQNGLNNLEPTSRPNASEGIELEELLKDIQKLSRSLNQIKIKLLANSPEVFETFAEAANVYEALSKKIAMFVQDTQSTTIHTFKALANDLQNLLGLVNKNIESNNVSPEETNSVVKDAQLKLANVLKSLKKSGEGTESCISTLSSLEGILADIDTTLIFVSAGMQSEGDPSSKPLKSDIECLLNSLETNLTQIPNALDETSVAGNIPKINNSLLMLSEKMKNMSAASIKDMSVQVALLTCFKELLQSSKDFVNEVKQSLHQKDSDSQKFEPKLEAIRNNITTVKQNIEGIENSKMQKNVTLNGAISAIAQEIEKSHQTNYADELVCSPEDLINTTKLVTSATSKTMAAGLSNDDLDIGSDSGRQALCDLLKMAAAASKFADIETKSTIMSAARECAKFYIKILQEMNLPDAKKENLREFSKNVAQSVTAVTRAAECLKGEDWVNPDDPTVIAERDLLVAAASIDAAAKKLALLKPRKTVVAEVDDSLNFEEQILEAAKAIAHASSALIKAASYTQKELIEKGIIDSEVSVRHHDEEYRWSKGLVSAAQHVAAATNSLCEAANAMVQGTGSEESLISSAKLVASSTAQLILAAQVKAGKESENMKRLQEAGTAVRKASENLVKAAESQKPAAEDGRSSTDGACGEDVDDGGKMRIRRMIEERDALIEVEKAERELREKREALLKKRQQLNYRKSLRRSQVPQ